MSEMLIKRFPTGSILDGMVSWWPLDEASGARVDVHGGLNLSEQEGSVGSAVGVVNDAAEFVNEYLAYADGVGGPLSFQGQQSFTLSGWAERYTAGSAGIETQLGKIFSGGSRAYAFTWAAGNILRFQVQASSGLTTVAAASAISLNTPFHFEGYHDAENDEIGIIINNGTPQVAAHSNGVFGNGADFVIGARDGSPIVGQFNGWVDEVVAHSRVLTPGERAQLYNDGNGMAYPG